MRSHVVSVGRVLDALCDAAIIMCITVQWLHVMSKWSSDKVNVIVWTMNILPCLTGKE